MFELRPYRKNEAQHAMYYNPFREMEEMERQFFRDPFAMFDSNGNFFLIPAERQETEKEKNDERAIIFQREQTN